MAVVVDSQQALHELQVASELDGRGDAVRSYLVRQSFLLKRAYDRGDYAVIGELLPGLMEALSEETRLDDLEDEHALRNAPVHVASGQEHGRAVIRLGMEMGR